VAVTPRNRAAASAARPFAALLSVALLSALFLSAAACAAAIDPAASAIGFTLKTRWGRTLAGDFPRYDGEIATLPDGRHQVRLRLSARDVEIQGSSSFTRLTRGEGFFDAERFPRVEYVSDPYPAELTREGGKLGGLLTIRGVQRREVFNIRPALCDRPGVECDVVASGSVDRNDYGVDRWGFALSSRVVFNLRVRTVAEGS
jgi:polyisoprenoid-binding protein YceI